MSEQWSEATESEHHEAMANNDGNYFLGYLHAPRKGKGYFKVEVSSC